MNWITSEVLNVLTFLLPGFVTVWVLHALVPFPKPSNFERIVQALIFTVVIQAFVVAVAWLSKTSGQVVAVGMWTDEVALIWSVLIALSLGLLFSRWANHDTLHAKLREKGFTNSASYPSEWFWEFSRRQTYVVLHLEGARRLYGWPEQWPSDPSRGQFSIAEPEWLDGDDRIPLTGVANVMVPATSVELVEFMDHITASESEVHCGDEGAESTAE